MSQVLTIENRNYIPAGAVGKHFGYTRDYILILAREGKIDGKKIGHRWYVNLESAEQYFSEAKEKKEERRQSISVVRKEELRAFSQKKKTHAYDTASRVSEIFAVSLILFIVGISGYVSFSSVSVEQRAALEVAENPFLKRLAISLYNLVSPKSLVIEDQSSVQAVQPSVEDSPDISTNGQNNLSEKMVYTSLVIAPGETFTATRTESIAESFSDDVSVSIDPHNPNTGIIIPHFKEKDGEPYRYLMVPVNESTE